MDQVMAGGEAGHAGRAGREPQERQEGAVDRRRGHRHAGGEHGVEVQHDAEGGLAGPGILRPLRANGGKVDWTATVALA